MVSLQLDTPELAAQYDIVGQRQFSHGKSLIQDLGIGKGARVLDVGAGTGLLAAHVANLIGSEGKLIAIDPLPSGLAEPERQKLRAVFNAELERLRDADGIRLERHLIFAVAEKPRVS